MSSETKSFIQEFGHEDKVFSEGLRKFFNRYEYKSARVHIEEVPDAPDQAVFFTVDLKLPDEGDAKILEFNDLESGLTGCPDGIQAITLRIYELMRATGKPVSVIFKKIDRENLPMTFALTGMIPDITQKIMGSAKDRAKEYGIIFFDDPSSFLDDGAEPLPFSETKGFVWVHDTTINPSAIRKDFITINGKVDLSREGDKTIFAEWSKTAGVERYRPLSWSFTPENVLEIATKALNESNADRFIIKPAKGYGGFGVVVMKREEIRKRISELFVEPPPDDSRFQLGVETPIEYWLRRENFFIFEEVVHSKPVKSETDGKLYDGTMRVVVVGLVSQGKIAVVPVGGYWKLPPVSLEGKGQQDAVVSNVHTKNPSSRVDDNDFKRAFGAVSKVTAAFVRP